MLGSSGVCFLRLVREVEWFFFFLGWLVLGIYLGNMFIRRGRWILWVFGGNFFRLSFYGYFGFRNWGVFWWDFE